MATLKRYKRELRLISKDYEDALTEGKIKAGKFGIYPVRWFKKIGTFHWNSDSAWMELD